MWGSQLKEEPESYDGRCQGDPRPGGDGDRQTVLLVKDDKSFSPFSGRECVPAVKNVITMTVVRSSDAICGFAGEA